MGVGGVGGGEASVSQQGFASVVCSSMLLKGCVVVGDGGKQVSHVHLRFDHEQWDGIPEMVESESFEIVYLDYVEVSQRVFS